MTRILLLAFWPAVCTSGLVAKELPPAAHRDTALGIVFPKTLGGLEFRGVKEYPEPELGYSLRYEGADLMKADVYIYDKGVPDIPAGCNNAIVKSEAESVRELLEIMQKRGYYKEVTFLENDVVPKQGDIQFLWHRFEYIQDKDSAYKGKRVSDRFVTGSAGKFVKITSTYKKTNTKTGQKVSDQLVKELTQILRKADDTRKGTVAKDILEAIETFRKDPLGNDSAIAMQQIVSFAKSSDDVLVTLSEKTCPWIMSKDKYKQETVNLLMVSYIAGNIEPQLKQKKPKDHSCEGVLQVLSTYKQLRMRKRIQKVESIEKWIKFQKAGKLKNYIEKQSNKTMDNDKE